MVDDHEKRTLDDQEHHWQATLAGRPDMFGREAAPKVALAIGATMSRPGSNEALWRGRRIVIKCAKTGNAHVGVTYAMLQTIDAIVAAFQRADGKFDLYELETSAYQAHMQATRSIYPDPSFRLIGRQ